MCQKKTEYVIRTNYDFYVQINENSYTHSRDLNPSVNRFTSPDEAKEKLIDSIILFNQIEIKDESEKVLLYMNERWVSSIKFNSLMAHPAIADALTFNSVAEARAALLVYFPEVKYEAVEI